MQHVSKVFPPQERGQNLIVATENINFHYHLLLSLSIH